MRFSSLKLAALVAAVLAVAPATALAANLLPNPSFSQTCPGADCGWIPATSTTISQDTSQFATSPASLKVESTGGDQSADAFSSCVPVTAGTIYLLSYNYRFSTAAHVRFVSGGVQFFSTACSGAPVSASFIGGLGTTTGDNQWRLIVGSAPAPTGATHAYVSLSVACDALLCPVGTFANFDEVGLDVLATTAARFRSLSVVATAAGTSVRWRTASEVDVAGFNVYRSWHGKRVRVNKRLIAAANASRGHSYRYLDRKARPGTRYWIEAVNLDGSRNVDGPARVGARS